MLFESPEKHNNAPFQDLSLMLARLCNRFRPSRAVLTTNSIPSSLTIYHTMSTEEPQAKKPKVEEQEVSHHDEKTAAKQNEEGDTYFELSKKRRLTIRSYRGKTLVDLREVRTT